MRFIAPCAVALLSLSFLVIPSPGVSGVVYNWSSVGPSANTFDATIVIRDEAWRSGSFSFNSEPEHITPFSSSPIEDFSFKWAIDEPRMGGDRASLEGFVVPCDEDRWAFGGDYCAQILGDPATEIISAKVWFTANVNIIGNTLEGYFYFGCSFCGFDISIGGGPIWNVVSIGSDRHNWNCYINSTRSCSQYFSAGVFQIDGRTIPVPEAGSLSLIMSGLVWLGVVFSAGLQKRWSLVREAAALSP